MGSFQYDIYPIKDIYWYGSSIRFANLAIACYSVLSNVVLLVSLVIWTLFDSLERQFIMLYTTHLALHASNRADIKLAARQQSQIYDRYLHRNAFSTRITIWLFYSTWIFRKPFIFSKYDISRLHSQLYFENSFTNRGFRSIGSKIKKKSESCHCVVIRIMPCSSFDLVLVSLNSYRWRLFSWCTMWDCAMPLDATEEDIATSAEHV